VLLLRPDMHGLVVDKSGSGNFWKDRNPTWLTDEAEPGGSTREAKGNDTSKGNGTDDGSQFYDFDTDN
jgi:hypothetical protein